MKNAIMRLLCWIGGHQWSEFYHHWDPPFQTRKCWRCLARERKEPGNANDDSMFNVT